MAIPASAWLTMGGGLLGGLFGGGGGAEMPPEIRRLLALQARIARERYQYSKGIPGSDPQEMAALAQAQGLLGEQAANQRAGMFGALGTTDMASGFGPDMLRNMDQSLLGQRASVNSAFLMDALERRQAAAGQAAGIAGGAAGSARYMDNGGGTNLASLIGNVAATMGQQQAMKDARAREATQKDAQRKQAALGFTPLSPSTGAGETYQGTADQMRSPSNYGSTYTDPSNPFRVYRR